MGDGITFTNDDNIIICHTHVAVDIGAAFVIGLKMVVSVLEQNVCFLSPFDFYELHSLALSHCQWTHLCRYVE